MHAVIVGAGASGVLHSLALRAAGVRISAIYDPDRTRARALSEVCDARIVDTLEAAASVDAEIAAICSPPSVHVAQAEALAGSSRTVFVEKPVATTRAELERLAALPRCVPVLQWRSGRALRAIRRAVAHGELGPAPVVACDLSWRRDDDYFRARRGWGCGAVLSIGIHAIDAIAWALDRPVESTASLTTARSSAEAETAAVAVFRFVGGAMASLRITLDGGSDATRITFCGNGRTAHLEGGEADPTIATVTWSAHDRARLRALENDTPGAVGSPLLVPYLGAAITALRDGASPGDSPNLLSVADTYGAHAAAMCLAAATRRR